MRSSAKLIVVALTGFAIGAIAGVPVGFELSSRIWARMSRSLSVATGNQAYNTLVLLDAHKHQELRHYLETEIDSTLASLQAMRAQKPFATDDPVGKLNERLLTYRREHPATGIPPATGVR